MLRMDRRTISLLSLAHVADDINQSFLPALLPLLVAQRHLSFAAAASLVLAQGLSSSVVQPAIGYLADTRAMPWLVGVGLLLAGGGIAAIGFVDSYALIFIAALISGLGVAMFHPEAARFSNLAAGEKKASGMRWFALGGNIGFATGPIFATAALALYGIAGTGLAAIPVAVMAVLLLLETKRLRTLLPNAKRAVDAKPLFDDWSSFARLTSFIVIRSMAYIGLVAFVPLYFVHVLHASAVVGNLALTAYLVAGIAGTLVGGPLADRFGRRIVISISTACALAFVLVLSFAVQAGAGIAAGFVCVALAGAVITGSQAAQIVLGQEYLPNRIGMASGVTLGLAVSLGTMASPALGALGDRYGLPATMLAIAGLAAVALVLSFTLPHPDDRRAHLAARAVA